VVSVSDFEPEDDRQRQVLSAVLKFLGIAVVFGLVIGLGTWFVVKSLDLNSNDTNSVGAPDPETTFSALPNSALPDPETTDEPTDQPTDDLTDGPLSLPTPTTDAPVLSGSPAIVAPMERINLTGQWQGQDSVSLLVQRFEDGQWVDFGVQVEVRLGSFATYVETSHEGPNKFRVYDPGTDRASNPVTVTVNG
jgi:hypothetical protein